MSEQKNTKNEFSGESSKGSQPKGGNGKKFPANPKFNFNFYWIYGIIIVLLIVTQMFSWGGAERETTYDQFERTMLLPKDVDKIEVTNDVAHIYIKREKLSEEKYKAINTKSFGKTENPGPHYFLNTGPAELFAKKIEEAQKDFLPADKVGLNYKQDTRSYWDVVLNWILPIGFFALIWILIMRRMGGGGGGSQIFNIGKSKAQLFDKDLVVKVTFNDVAGLEEAKVEVMEIVDFLKNPKKYTSLGGKIPRGALLVGPPGTGKTLLAKAMAGEAQVPFFSLSGSDFVEMFVGVGASRVRDLFRQAKEKAPCIIFIDEIDAIGRARGKSPSFSANDERESTLNQLLTEMDGFGSNSGVIIIAATNRADILDRALLRPGRFDRQIYVELPDLNGRKEIFEVHLKPLKINDTLDVDFLARQTPGFSGADIANVCNEAALIAARNNKLAIDKQDFIDAIDRIIGGLEKKNKIISPQEKEVIAYHEAGHAAVSWLLEHAHPLVKVTIVPRGNSLGAAWYLPEERSITTTEQLMDEICAALGGRVAEEIAFGKISTGALSDLEKITKQAYAMTTIYGLNEKIGNISFYDSSGQQEYTFGKPYSEKTAQIIDEEVKKLIDIAYARTKDILLRNKAKLETLAKHLLEKEVLFKEDLEKIFGKRQWADRHEVLIKPAVTNGEEKKVSVKAEGTTDTPPITVPPDSEPGLA